MASRNPRLYGLFYRVNGKYERQYPNLAYTLPTARRLFQSFLIAGSLSGKGACLRPVTAEKESGTYGN